MLLLKRHKAMREIKNSLFAAFPEYLHDDVDVVIHCIDASLFAGRKLEYNLHAAKYRFILPNREQVSIPYRLWLADYPNDKKLSPVQRGILHCIYSRSTDGYVREKHIKALMEADMPFWVFPFVLKLSDEYVIEIVEAIYGGLKDRENADLQAFCQMNLSYFVYSHARMISYWAYFYREKCYKYRNYVGKKLYHECFGYSRRLEKELLSNA